MLHIFIDMKKRRIILIKRASLIFAVVAVAVVICVATVLFFVSDNTLKNAAKWCDTITMKVQYNPSTQNLAGMQSITYTNRSDTNLEEVKFHIYANAYRDGAENPPVSPTEVPQAYPNGKNFGGITIHGVKVDNVNTVPTIESDETVLNVPLTAVLKPNQKVSIDIDYSVKLANIKHRLGFTDASVNLGNFYPVPCIFEGGKWQTYPYSFSGDPFYNALHNFNVTFIAPKDYVLACSGEIMKETESGDLRITDLKSYAIRDWAAVLSKNFKTLTQRLGKTLVKYYYLDDEKPRDSLNTSVKTLKHFSKIFAEYPYANLSVVQTDFLHGGMEYGELVYIATGLTKEEHDRVIVHEIAHQWWYGMVGNNQSRTAWIDEGLAEYSTLLFYDAHPEYSVNSKQVIENARASFTGFVKLVRGIGGALDFNMERDLNAFNSSYEYVYLTYVRGMLLFCDLETIISRASLTNALGEFSRITQFGQATKQGLISTIEKQTSYKVGLFFETYLSGY